MKMIAGIFYPEKNIDINGGKYFVPASNTKLFTSYFALKVLGNDHVFHSCFYSSNKKLYIKTLGNPLITQNDVIEMVKSIDSEIEEINLYHNYLEPTPFPPGWCIDDIGESYAPPVSEINYELNRIIVENGKMFPKNDLFKIKMHEGKTLRDGKTIFLNHRKIEYSFSPENPVQLFKNSLMLILRERGLLSEKVKFNYKNFDLECKNFAERSIAEMLKIMNKESENSLAETLLLYTGMVAGHSGLKNSLKYMKKLAIEDGIKNFLLYDGSGLSRYNLVTPKTIVNLLEKLNGNEIFINSLPIGGVDGTLKNRLDPRVKAKTGTLSHVQNLSGYFNSNPFSIMVTGITDQKSGKRFIDNFIIKNF